MKKLVFMFAAIVAVSFASCGGNAQNAEATDSLATDSAVCTEVCDSAKACCDSAAAVCDSAAAVCCDSVK